MLQKCYLLQTFRRFDETYFSTIFIMLFILYIKYYFRNFVEKYYIYVETGEKFPIMPVLRNMETGETVDFPIGRDNIDYTDRRQSIRSTAQNLRRLEGMRFTVRVESERTRVTRLDDDPDFTGRHTARKPRTPRPGSVRGELLRLPLGEYLRYPLERAPYLRSLAGSLWRTDGRRYSVEIEAGKVFVTCTGVTENASRKRITDDPLFR